jgi:lysophospholipase L1-like esterase
VPGIERHHRQIGVGKIAIVLRLLFRALRPRRAARFVVAAGLLHHVAAGFDPLHLPFELVFDGTTDEAKRVQVLDLDLGAEKLLAHRAHRDVGVAAQAALFHVGVARAGEEQHLVQGLEIVDRLRRGPQVGLGDDLDEGHAATVEIDARRSRNVVQQLAGVLFEMQTVDADAPRRVGGERKPAALRQRLFVLTDLVALRQIGIEVVLAREDRPRPHGAVKRQRQARGEFDGARVGHRQRAGVAETDRTHQRVGFGAEAVRAAAEHLRRGAQLDVHLEPDHRFPSHAASLVERRDAGGGRRAAGVRESLAMGRLNAFAAWVFLAPLASSCGPDVAHLDSPGRTIVALGDSITAGYGAGPGETFPERLQTLLGATVVARGVPGDTSAGGLGRLDQALAEQPWLVIVELGGNDILQRVPLEETEKNLRGILETLRARRVAAILVGVRAPLIGGRYADLFDRLADDFDVPLVDDALVDILSDPALKADEIHPNAAGHRRLAEAVADVLRPLVDERRRRGFPVASP